MDIILQKEIKQIMGQQMYQSLNFLQMGPEELEEYLNSLCNENPILEAVPAVKQMEGRFFSQISGHVRRHDGELSMLPIPDRAGVSLADFLQEQLMTANLDIKLRKAVEFVIVNLDSRGYINPELKDSPYYKAHAKLCDKALTVIRSLEPAGVGAYDLSDSLCIQLERLLLKNSVAWKICKDYLEHLAKNHIYHISKQLGITEKEVTDARDLIRTLNPYPANGFDDGSSTPGIIPDLIVKIENAEPVIYTGEDYMPSFRLDSTYIKMAADPNLSDEDREYFKEKIEQAKWAVNCIKHRKETIMNCASEIVRLQWPFFSENDGSLRPCTMSSMADILGVHLSTVSRCVRNKFILCDRGIFPMSYFFTPEVSGETSDEIIKVIKNIINSENPYHPLSDSDICSELSRLGYDIARRTVAKYRDRSGIPPATGRKRRDNCEK